MRAPRFTRGLHRDEWLRLSGFGAVVAALHVVGWGLFLYYSGRYRPLVGLGLTAYLFGLRHAFDADHIAAIDNTTRKLLRAGEAVDGRGLLLLARPLDRRLLARRRPRPRGHAPRTRDIPAFQHYGGYVGAGVSGTFLWIIGILNLVVLVDIIRIFREMRGGDYDRERLENRLLERGMMSRFFGRVLPPDRRELADVSARPAVRARVRHGDRGRPARARRGRRHPLGAFSRSSPCRSCSPRG